MFEISVVYIHHHLVEELHDDKIVVILEYLKAPTIYGKKDDMVTWSFGDAQYFEDVFRGDGEVVYVPKRILRS